MPKTKCNAINIKTFHSLSMNRHIFDSNTKMMCQEMKWLYVLDVQPELIKVTQQRTTSQETTKCL